ncbi:signal transduction protein-like protein Syg1 [Halenospora varia]|nr:signal transduction protein-like protein Syg1 [Halenospora varia]
MKFAKELEQDLVPEWRAKYLDYKAGKKHIKAVARARNRMNATPRAPNAPKGPVPQNRSLYGSTSPFTPRNRPPSTLRRAETVANGETQPLQASAKVAAEDSQKDSGESSEDPSAPWKHTPPMPIPHHKRAPGPLDENTGYGSFVPTPPTRQKVPFELPEPAIDTESPARIEAEPSTPKGRKPAPLRSASMTAPNAYEIGPTTPPPRSAYASIRNRVPQNGNVRGSLRRMFTSVQYPHTPSEARRIDMDMEAIDQVRVRQKEFFKYMDKELNKVETFYKEKEEEAGDRLKVLRDQLHEMRNRRIDEVAAAQHAKAIRKEDERSVFDFNRTWANGKQKGNGEASRPTSKDHLNAWFDPLDRALEHAKAKAFGPHPGSNSKSLQKMQESPEMRAKTQAHRNAGFDSRDYVQRHNYEDEVPYRTAKRKLKLALQEFYRGMELLKSYALLNRTAFRKINKKYDKAVDADPPLRYMAEKVNKTWFVQSDVLDGHLHAVEDLYARYFERGNRKVAVGKLKSDSGKSRDQSASAFRNGILIGTGLVFGVQGLIYGRQLLVHPDPTIRLQTSYLLQIYAGYFLALYLFCWFCLCCSIWARNKINYAFVFEFDPRHHLDWRQLSEFPSSIVLVLGLFVWVNFSGYGTPEMYIYYPVILIFVTALLIFFPGPALYHRSRKWFVYSHNVELFFCLYANEWNNPGQCNSAHSRLLGFFSTLPAIWRLFQCLRRYYDTRNIFPHLVNGGKYCASIVYYVTLSLYRIDRTNSKLAIFITFAAVNAAYVSVWDLLMDWSVLQPQASKKWLRDVRGFKPTWWYYTAMFLDPIFRFNWIFYAIFTHNTQHSTLASFFVAFSEVTRRGIWTLFRVENEHCSNVARFKASRDVPLPYCIPTPSEEDFQRYEATAIPEQDATQATPTPSQFSRVRTRTSSMLEAGELPGSSSLRRRLAPQRTFTSIVADAHTQDFEKKRKPGAGDSDSAGNRRRDGEDVDGVRMAGAESSDSDGDDENDVQDLWDAEALLKARDRAGTASRTAEAGSRGGAS